MSLGDPVFLESFTYGINVNHSNGDSLVIQITRMDFNNPVDVDQPVQDLVDMLSADPRWTVTGATKHSPAVREFTPTPPAEA